ncbi:hypothetical protein ACFRMQ_30420 [Kitasatospora sp. NPDC056783]|uniref:hypothetical protein n=1 Tax=Kitasatospora sp. NPDC056783 TaxID=3345943 RepID=UPI003681FD88
MGGAGEEDVRLKCQEDLTARPTSSFNFVIYEAAFHTNIGGSEALGVADSAEFIEKVAGQL